MVKVVAMDLITGEEIEIGQASISDSSKVSEEYIHRKTRLGESYNGDFIINPKKITKKRFIKLLMSKGIQRNIANIIHQEYMKTHEVRTYIGMWVFITGLIR